ncbi:hypothetical protein JXJ21_18400 [candidate division KSB1 bacterium]|nr:hypothetical protein [candidate division KSB1 bacterium]
MKEYIIQITLTISCFLLLSAASITANTSREDMEPECVLLAGTPQQVGTLWGKLNKTAIQADLERAFLAPAREHQISDKTLIKRSKRFIEISREIAPHWLEEAVAIAGAADVDAKLYTAFIANVYRNLFLHECTSYAINPKYVEGSSIFFHKNRDNQPKKQSAFILQSSLSSINKFISVSDASVLSCMMMVNEAGLAGSADTGGEAGTPQFKGLMNTFILRYIAEKAFNCSDALSIIQDFVARGYYAGGDKTGTHWLFVDRSGAILEVQNSSDSVGFEFHQEKIYFSARKESAAAKTLMEATEPIDFHRFHNLSRDPSICFNSSVSGMTVEIHRTYPQYLTCAWFSFPAKSLAFPLFMGCEATPAVLMNGKLDALARQVDRPKSVWENLEKHAYSNKKRIIETCESLIKQGSCAPAKKMMDEWIRNYVRDHLAVLNSQVTSVKSNH